MSGAEFSRRVDLRGIRDEPLRIEATEEERTALARRFDLVAIERLEATVSFEVEGENVDVAGTLEADVVQSCAVSGDDLPVTIRERLVLRFVPETPILEEEIELEEADLDEIPYSGTTFDLGEAVAQSLALAIDPFATGPDADRVRREKGLSDEAASGPFAALAALKKT
ncbi:MAG: YceD family protein [Croceibacterium sp.]